MVDPDRVVWESGLVRVGAFRCPVGDPLFFDSGPARNYCFVFPRTAVSIQHEDERAFVANPNIVTFYNCGQEYRRGAISPHGDRCDWFGVSAEVARDVVRSFDEAVDDRPERPFRFSRGLSDATSFLMQRRLFASVAAGGPVEALALEEAVIALLERVVGSVYGARRSGAPVKQEDAICEAERILSRNWDRDLHLADVAREVGLSVYHLCRTFRRITGNTLHQYRSELRVRACLELVAAPGARLVDVAMDAGFCSHSHFTNAFHRAFGEPPSALRDCGGATF